MNNINIDYIGVVKENRTGYTFERIVIEKSAKLLDELNAMFDNPNRTVLDMQECFKMHFKNSNKKSYDCCLPYSYYSSYGNCVCYPEFIDYDKYNADKEQLIKDASKLYEERESSLSEWVNAEIERKQRQYKDDLKKNFLERAVRYINAGDFAVARARTKTDNTVKMASHEFIGWTNIEHKINEDLTISVKTNFGYGASSYFVVNVRYKEIDLLPYSFLVQYYYARMSHILACTRNYDAERDSWKIALDFVAEIGTGTKQGNLRYAREWLTNEITEMTKGLKHIQHKPKEVIEEMRSRNTEVAGLRSVRYMNSSEEGLYKVYPEELTTVFKIEKITCALDFIDKLKLIGDIYPQAQDAIDTINEINRSIAPEVSDTITKVENGIAVTNGKIAKLQKKLEPLIESQANYGESIKKHELALSELYKQEGSHSQEEINKKYRLEHLEFKALEKDYEILNEPIKELKNQIRELNIELGTREDFLSRLQRCYTRIAEARLIAA